MSEYIDVPTHVAESIAKTFQKSMVVILCYDPKFDVTHTTTYGASAFDKENAAAVGAKCTKAIGADLSKKHTFEDFHDDYDPARYKEATDLLKTIFQRQDGSPFMLQRVERFLKSIGLGVRS